MLSHVHLQLLRLFADVLALPTVGVGKHFEIFRGPQNILVGPIWRSLSQKTRPHRHFWVPIRPNPFFALFIRGKGPKTGQKSADFKIRLILAQK